MKALEIVKIEDIGEGRPMKKIEECPIIAYPSCCIDCPYCKGFNYKKDLSEEDPDVLYRVDYTYVWCDHPNFKEKKKIFKGCDWYYDNEHYMLTIKDINTRKMKVIKSTNEYKTLVVDFCPRCGKDYEGHLIEE